MLGEHREITGIVDFKHLGFGFGVCNSSYDCDLVMFNASDLLKWTLQGLVVIILPY